MATLKGDNLRVLIFDSTEEKFIVVAMATNCTISLTNNTDDASTKDDVGLVSLPTTTSKSWQVSVDSLNVTDAAAILTAIKAMQPMTLLWDETNTTDNQTTLGTIMQRIGTAYMSDVNFTFNNRENSAKTVQFIGSGELTHDTTAPMETIAVSDTYTKGQFVRLFLSANNTAAASDVIGAARTLQLHVSVSLEDATTKDTSGDWQIQEPTAISYDITTNALVRSGETITSQVGAKSLSDLETIYNAGTPVKWKIANVGDSNNRTASSTIVSGSALITKLDLNGPSKQRADYTATLNGYGAFTVAA